MDWQQLKDSIYYLDGSLRDIYVHGTTRNDWHVWADFVNQNYQISFYLSGTEIKSDGINIKKVFEYWDGINKNGLTATVFINGIKMNVHFFSENEIENDIVPAEIHSIEDHIKIINYLVQISKVLNKRITLTPENLPEVELIIVDQDDITINAM